MHIENSFILLKFILDPTCFIFFCFTGGLCSRQCYSYFLIRRIISLYVLLAREEFNSRKIIKNEVCFKVSLQVSERRFQTKM